MLNSSRLKTISFYTLKELLKSRILYNVLFLGLFLCLASYVIYEFSYGSQEKVALDVGLGLMTFSCIGIAIFMGSTLMTSEIENRTLHMILSRPVSRSEFLLGRILGLLLMLLINILIFSVLIFTIYWILGGEFHKIIFHQLAMTYFESIIVFLIVINLSLMTNIVLTIINTIAIYFIGHSFETIYSLSLVQHNPAIKLVIKTSSYILPDFSRINYKPYIFYQEFYPQLNFTFSYFYSIGYVFALIIVSVIIFEQKSLD
jgi:ABC-type transport system involved in multi-copper enzyme maturation permease subunit